MINHGQQLGSLAEGVKGADLDKTFQRAAVHLTQINPLAEIFDVLEGASLLSDGQDDLYRPFAHILHCS